MNVIDDVYDEEFLRAKERYFRHLLSSGKDFHKTELRVALVLLEYTSGVEFTLTKHLVSSPGLERIARFLQISQDQVRFWEKSLIKRGVISIEGDNRGGRTKTTQFVFNPEWFADDSKIAAWGKSSFD